MRPPTAASLAFRLRRRRTRRRTAGCFQPGCSIGPTMTQPASPMPGNWEPARPVYGLRTTWRPRPATCSPFMAAFPLRWTTRCRPREQWGSRSARFALSRSRWRWNGASISAMGGATPLPLMCPADLTLLPSRRGWKWKAMRRRALSGPPEPTFSRMAAYPYPGRWLLIGVAGGFAVSGGVQPSLSRLDIGPQLSVRFPLGHGHARVAVEWRERVAGNARPASGPAIMLASDF